jgi:hypothetical protein
MTSQATFIIIMMFISFYVLQEKLAKDKARMHHRQNSPERDLTLDLSQIRISKDRSKRRSGEILRYIVVVSFIGGENRITRKKTTDLPQVTEELYHIML